MWKNWEFNKRPKPDKHGLRTVLELVSFSGIRWMNRTRRKTIELYKKPKARPGESSDVRNATYFQAYSVTLAGFK
jgi:hypothetical protein